MFKFFKSLFQSPTSPAQGDFKGSIQQLLDLNDEGVVAFVNRDLEHFREKDKAMFQLLENFKQDFLFSIADFDSNGKLLGFKPGVDDGQISYVTKTATQILEKIQKLQEVNVELKQGLVKSVEKETDFNKFRREIDAAMTPGFSGNLREHFTSKAGQEAVEELEKARQTDTYKRYWKEMEENGKVSYETMEAYYKETNPKMWKHYMTYGLPLELRDCLGLVDEKEYDEG